MTGLMISMHTQFSDKYICWDNKVKKKEKKRKDSLNAKIKKSSYGV